LGWPEHDAAGPRMEETVKNRFAATAVGCWLLASAAASWAYPLDDVRVEWWTGSGAHEVLLVVDFWPGENLADSFAFGYRFDSAEITGAQLLDAIAAAGHGFSYAVVGGFVNDIWYVKNGITYHGTYDWPISYLSYWVSTNHGEVWDYSLYGIDTRILHDGDTDGWLALPGDDYTSEPIVPLVYTRRGDLNCDGSFNFGDINPFVIALVSPAQYATLFPDCPILNGDINGDGSVNFGDINPFVELMFIDP
jgi:hypothetical protein